MAMPFFNQANNLGKNKKQSNLNSSWAFLLSTLIYISIFYFFNLSPSTLVRTTKFWFILSNTLIFIIAADSRPFSSSSKQFIDEYNSRPEANLPYNLHIVKYEKTTSNRHARVVEQPPPEKIITVVAAEPQEITLQEKHQQANDVGITDEKIESRVEETEDGEGEVALPTSKSSERDEEALRLEENEFSRMSDEEVNKRVEEFIRRFNRQIRLQASRNRR